MRIIINNGSINEDHMKEAMMKYLLLTLMMMGVVAFTPAFAGDDDYDDERTRHFEIQEPNGWQEAIMVLEEKGDAMKAAYAAKDYNTMHELSYHLEVAADVLEEEAEELMEAVEAVHHATEDGKFKEVEQKFPELEARLDEIVQ